MKSVKLGGLPPNRKGKIDRAELGARHASDRDQRTSAPTAPRNEIERTLARLWCETLGLSGVGIHDNFFALGGDSIKAIQVVSRLTAFGLSGEVRQLFEHPSIADLAPRLTPVAAGGAAPAQAPQGRVVGPVPLTPIQHWLFRDFAGPVRHMNQAVLLAAEQRLDPPRLADALAALLEHHDALRATFVHDDGGIRQEFQAESIVSLETLDLGAAAGDLAAAITACAEQVQASFDLARGPLLKAVLLRCPDGDRLLLVIHHLVVDGLSWRILFADLTAAYTALIRGEAPRLPPKTASFKAWAEALTAAAAGAALDGERAHWQAVAAARVPPLPTVGEGTGRHRDSRTLEVALSAEETRGLLAGSHHAYNTRINDLLLAGLAAALCRWHGGERTRLLLESHGRDFASADLDVGRTVGWFTSMYPVLLDLTGVAPGDRGRQIKTVKEQLRHVPGQGLGWGLLHYLAGGLGAAAPAPRITFNYLGQFDADLTGTPWRFAAEATGNPVSPDSRLPHELSCYGIVRDGRLALYVNFDPGRFAPASVRGLLEDYRAGLLEIVAHCRSRTAAEPTPADLTWPHLTLAELERLAAAAGLTPADIADVYPLAPLQAGILYEHLYAADSPAYFLQLDYRILGRLDPELFERAWNLLIERHAILRTVFPNAGRDRPLQVVRRHLGLRVTVEDWRGLDAGEQQTRLAAFKRADRARGFDLGRDTLLRLAVIRLADEIFQVVWSFHHIILDGWCSGILYRELLQLYQALAEGQVPDLPPPTPYATYIRWLGARDEAAADRWWTDYLAGFETPTGVPHRGGAPIAAAAADRSHGQHCFSLDAELTAALGRLAARHQVTLYSVLTACWALLLARCNDSDDVLFGVTVSGRPEAIPGIEDMIGLFINTLPSRVRLAAQMRVGELLREVQADGARCQAYREHPLQRIQACSPLRQGLFDHLLVFENYPVGQSLRERRADFPWFHVADSGVFARINYDLGLFISPGKTVELILEHDLDAYPTSAARTIEGYLRTIVAAVLADDTAPIAAIGLIDETERHRLLVDWNRTRMNYPADLCLHQLVEAQVRRTPEATALIAGEERLDYRTLEARANRLAQRLAELGIGPGSLVGILLPRTPDLPVAMLGILKAGAAYLPLDPGYPQPRLHYMLTQSAAGLLVTSTALAAQAEALRAATATLPVLDLTAERERLAAQPCTAPRSGVGPQDLACVLYTSGSTGQPKGVALEHRGQVGAMAWAQHLHAPAELAGVLAGTSCSFDMAQHEIFLPWCRGGALILAEHVLELPRLPHAGQVTLINTVPSVARGLLAAGGLPPAVQTLILGGEPLSTALVEALYRAAPGLRRIYDVYGPAETGYSTCMLRRPGEPASVGRPNANWCVYILDRQRRPVPPGIAGEIYIGGVGVARGYHQAPEETARRFIPNPFPTAAGLPHCPRLYQTGDLARFLPDGTIELLGRRDHQIKIRGFRIELGEIESVLSGFPGATEVAVVARDSGGERRLVAYLAMARGTEEARALADRLRAYAAERLPDYMVPGQFVVMQALPHNPNGKLDRLRLPEPTPLARPRVAPRNALEAALAATWTQVLGIPEPGVHDNFFELGGDSIKAIQVIARLAERGFSCRLRHFIDHPDIATLAPLLAGAAEQPPVPQDTVAGVVPVTPIQHWLLRDLRTPRHWFNNGVLLKAEERLDPAALRTALQALFEHHDALRITIREGANGTLEQYNQPAMDCALEVLTLADPTALAPAADRLQASIDLAAGPLLKALLLRLPDGDRVLLVAHHLIIDGVSWRLLFADLSAAYAAARAGQPPQLPPKTAAFKTWAERLAAIAATAALDGELPYWRRLLATPCPVLPLRPAAGPSLVRNAMTETLELTAQDTAALLGEIHRVYNTRINDVLLTALALTLAHWHGGRRTLVALESHGRDFPAVGLDLSRTVGWLTALYPVLLELAEGPDLGEQLNKIKEDLRAVPGNGVGYGVLRWLTDRLADGPLPEVAFNYLGRFDQDLPAAGPWRFAPESSGQAAAPDGELPYQLFFSGIVKQSRLRLMLVCDPVRVDRTTAAGLLESFRNNLLGIVDLCRSRPAAARAQPPAPIAGLPPIIPRPEERYEPFPLSEIQQAYWVGRGSGFELGNVSTHTYVELDCPDLDLERFERAWQRLIKRHEMLRMIVLPSGLQQFLREVPVFRLPVLDLRGQPPAAAATALAEVRETMSHQVLPAARWPLFDLRATRLADGRIVLHVGLDALVADAWGMRLLSRELLTLYHRPDTELEPLTLSFRDYILAERTWQQTAWYQHSLEYWRARLDSLPPPPELPLARLPGSLTQPRFERRESTLAAAPWQRLKERAARAGLTPSGLLLAAFAEVLGRWSKSPRFTLNLTLFNRIPVHPEVNALVGDFTSLILVAIDQEPTAQCAPEGFLGRAKRVQQQLWQDLEHRHVNGVTVLRELARHRGNPQAAAMPVVFTSTLTLVDFEQPVDLPPLGETLYGIGQTPQVWLDHQVSEEQGRLKFDWDAIADLFPDGLLDDLFAAYCGLLERLAAPDARWHEGVWREAPGGPDDLLPVRQHERLLAVNRTAAPCSEDLLDRLFLAQAARDGEALAVVAPDHALTYRELAERAAALAARLRAAGAAPNTLVAVIMTKGWAQVVAVYGVLLAGAGYLPIDPDLPDRRRQDLLEQGQVRLAVTQPELLATLTWPPAIERLAVTWDDPGAAAPVGLPTLRRAPTDIAYVIFTSGSTGRPKGVTIDHRGAVNTILDVNERYGVTARDRLLGLSALSFDLSVYDIFGVLAAGATLVLPAAERARDPSHWVELMQRHRVSLWNSVPALLQVLADHLAARPSRPRGGHLRLCLLSGDWIPLDLPTTIRALWPDLAVHSLGGATEASIWSICFPVGAIDPAWRSIPYGRPMRNQTVQVLDAHLRPCPTWVTGLLYIGGIGLAQGYWGDPDKTAARFIIHPYTGERLYRTGDLGRRLPDGTIEFLGREDFQVKLRGYRIELGEIESALRDHPQVRETVVTVADGQLVAYVVPRRPQTEDYGSAPTGDILMDQVARLEHKLRQPGLRGGSAAPGSQALPRPTLDEALTQTYLARQSYRDFRAEPLPLAALAALLAGLMALPVAGAPLPKYRYPSAGNAYPVQTYLSVRPGRVEGLTAGIYYYHPVAHRLDPVAPGDGVAGAAYAEHGDFNRRIFEQSAFGLFLIGRLDAIRPLYGDWARDFCLLEAGYMSQLLMELAPAHGIGLCPIGSLDFASRRELFRLESDQILLHSHLGGPIAPEQTRHWMQSGHQAAADGTAALREHLRERLPAHLLPSRILMLDALPLSANGKVDRAALPAAARPAVAAATDRQALATDLERQLARHWEELLGVAAVQAQDDFFALGGDSLLAIRLTTVLREQLAPPLALRDLYQTPVLADLALRIGALRVAGTGADSCADDDEASIHEL